MSENFTEINDFILDQIYGYQDANEVKNNTLRLRDALSLEHTWSSIDDTDLGRHSNYFLTEDMIGSNVVSKNKLKLTSQTINFTISTGTAAHSYLRFLTSPVSLTGDDEYRFSPNITAVSGFASSEHLGVIITPLSYGDAVDSLRPVGSAVSSISGTLTCVVYHFTATPPHKFLGEDDYGKFLWVLRDKDTKEMVTSTIMDDPIWFNHRKDIYPKNHPYLPMLKPHPFADYAPFTDKDPIEDNLEIVMVDMRQFKELVDVDYEETKQKKLEGVREELLASGIEESEIRNFEESLINKKVVSQEKKTKTKKELDRLLKLKKQFLKEIQLPSNRTKAALDFIESTNRHLENQITKAKESSGKGTLWEYLNLKLTEGKVDLATKICRGDFPEITQANDELSPEEQKLVPGGNFSKYVRIVKPKPLKIKKEKREK